MSLWHNWQLHVPSDRNLVSSDLDTCVGTSMWVYDRCHNQTKPNLRYSNQPV